MTAKPAFHTYVDQLISVNVDELSASEITTFLEAIPVGDFTRECIEVVAAKAVLPDSFKGIAGIGLWPVPLYIPLFLAKTIYLLEESIVRLRRAHDWERGQKMVAIRQIFVSLACSQDKIDGEPMSDLSGDHCGAYLRDHPEIRSINPGDEEQLPWWPYCSLVSRETSALKLLGILGDNEEGSIEEIEALYVNGVMTDGDYYKLHSIAEEEHVRHTSEMTDIIATEPDWNLTYRRGKLRNRQIYASIVSRL